MVHDLAGTNIPEILHVTNLQQFLAFFVLDDSSQLPYAEKNESRCGQVHQIGHLIVGQ